MILYIKHIDIEGPETLGDFFHVKDFAARIIDLSAGEKLPSTLEDLEAVVSLGGPINVYEENKYPFLKEETFFLRQVIDDDVPLLGICLGAQLVAKACGAKVKKAPVEEIGWRKVQLTTEGQLDPLFFGVGPELDVFQWHGDTFDIPKNATLLATGKQCPHQAFRFGNTAYGLQFHVEVTGKTVAEWAEAYFKKNNSSQQAKRKKMLAEYNNNQEFLKEQTQQIYNNFLHIINSKIY